MTKENEMKKMTAHFWNLNEDPQLTNMVAHFLQPGKIFLLGYDGRDYQPYLTTTLPGSVGIRTREIAVQVPDRNLHITNRLTSNELCITHEQMRNDKTSFQNIFYFF